jgi:CRISP-associated protein Cas1
MLVSGLVLGLDWGKITMRNYYVFSNGRVQREDNTIYVVNAEGKKRPLPVEDIDTFFVYGEVDINTKLLNFLAQRKIVLHVFNYYGYYSGSWYPREYLHSGFLLVHQVNHYTDTAKRTFLARELVAAAAHSLRCNLAYYERRKGGEKEESSEPPGEIVSEGEAETEKAAMEAAVDASVALPDLGEEAEYDPFESGAGFVTNDSLAMIKTTLESLSSLLPAQKEVKQIMGIEGKMRERYYAAWGHILSGEWDFSRRVKRPPDNEVNALISFGNSFLYGVCLSEIYRTQLTPTISYLHEPGARRFSLALDLSEIFKPLLVDRTIFTLLNKGQLKESHFDKTMDGCFLNETGKKLFLNALEARLATTIKHRRLGRHVSYRHLIRLECYKLIRHLTGVETYRGFRAWW